MPRVKEGLTDEEARDITRLANVVTRHLETLSAAWCEKHNRWKDDQAYMATATTALDLIAAQVLFNCIDDGDLQEGLREHFRATKMHLDGIVKRAGK